jgi:hypothetical protein
MREALWRIRDANDPSATSVGDYGIVASGRPSLVARRTRFIPKPFAFRTVWAVGEERNVLLGVTPETVLTVAARLR